MTQIISDLNVSRETMAKLDLYADLLRKWNPKINLVSKSTLDDIQARHMDDSAQLLNLAGEDVKTWMDFGSGAGFPGLVIAILASELRPNLSVTLVESDQRKCAFLRTVARETGTTVKVIADRIEKLHPSQADVISARALADLDTLLSFADRHLDKNGICLFPKGITWEKELLAARDSWSFDCEVIKSEIIENSVILKVKGITHV